MSSLFNLYIPIQTVRSQFKSQSLRKKLRSNQKKNAAVHFQLLQVFIPTISAKESLHLFVGMRSLRPEPVRQFIWTGRPFRLAEWQRQLTAIATTKSFTIVHSHPLASIVGRYTSNIFKNVANIFNHWSDFRVGNLVPVFHHAISCCTCPILSQTVKICCIQTTRSASSSQNLKVVEDLSMSTLSTTTLYFFAI